MSMRWLLRSRSQNGFTLLEIIATLVIMAIAVLGFQQGQAGSIRLSVRSEYLAVATGLAQQKMTEVELKLKKQNFLSLPDEEKGDFKDDKFKPFSWSRKVEKVDLGCFFPTPSPSTDPTQANGLPTGMDIIQKMIEQSARKIKVTIQWKEGNLAREFSLAQLYVRFEDIQGIQVPQ